MKIITTESASTKTPFYAMVVALKCLEIEAKEQNHVSN